MSIHHYFVSAASLLVTVLLIIRLFSVKAPKETDGDKKSKRAEVFTDGDSTAPVLRLAASPYFVALAVLTALYGVSFLQAINPREALFTWLRHIDYLLTFVLVFVAANIWKKEGGGADFTRWLLVALAVAGTAVAASGILSAQGLISIEGCLAFGRLASTFQYPNSFAAYLTAILIITACLAVQANRPFAAGVLAGMIYLLFLAIIGSQSRGMLVMLPLILAIFILGQASRRRVVLLLGIPLGLALSMAPFTVGPHAQQAYPNWGAFLWTMSGCLAVGNTLGFLTARAQKIPLLQNKKPGRQGWKKKSFSPTGMTIVVIAILCILIVLPALKVSGGGGDTGGSGQSPLHRISNIGVGESSLQYRFEFYRNALSMINERPLLGWGGGGWKSGYTAHQSFNYFSTQVHSHYLQVWIEAGTAGLIVFALPFVLLLRGLRLILPMRRIHPLAPETWAIGTVVLALGMHAAIDFDLSFSSISLLLWSMLALFACREKDMGIGLAVPGIKRHSPTFGKNTGIPVLTALLVTGLTLASVYLAAQTFVLNKAADRAQEAVIAARQGNLKAALENMQAAARLDRWSARYPALQGGILMARNQGSPGRTQEHRLQQSIGLARQAVKLDSYNPDYHFFLARMHLSGGELEKALAGAEWAKELKPWHIQSYEQYNSIFVDAAVQQMLWNREKDAARTLGRVLANTQEAVNKKKTLSPRLQRLWDTRRDLFLTPTLAVTAGQSALLLGNIKLARDYLSRAAGTSDERTKNIARLWLGVAMKKDGDPSGADLIQEACRASNEAQAEYYILQQLMN
ncbi:MAG: O-antigen ligase family protein [Firmicutes bacterium]|nr:O-antigen ligase family protein [Bacillota bacterium]